MKKRMLSLLLLSVLSVQLLTGCGSTNETKEETATLQEQKSDVEPYTFTVSIDRNEQGLMVEQTVTKVPSRVICSGYQMAYMLLDLGLEDHIAGVITTRPESVGACYAPEVGELAKNLEVLGSSSDFSKENMLAEGCDFLIGWDTTFSDERYSVDFCQQNEIIMYTPYCTYDAADSMDDIYKDYETLGKIFHVEEVAKEKIEKMKEVVSEVETKLASVTEPVTILNYDSGETDVFTACQGMPGAIFKYAGGISIFDDIEKGWARVSWEQIVDRNPEVIIINNYSGSEEEAAESEAFLKSVDALQNVDAIKNDRIYAVYLDDIEGSAGSAYLIRHLAELLYPELF